MLEPGILLEESENDTKPLLLENKQQTYYNSGSNPDLKNVTDGQQPNNSNNNNNNSQRDPLSPQNYKLSRLEKLSYGVGEGGLSVFQMIKGFFLNSFLLSVAQLDPFYSAIILFTTKFVDAFSDILVGSFSDKTKSRFGRRRVWILFGSLPLAIFYTMLWYVPDTSQTLKVIYYQFVVIVLSVAYTCVAIPYSAMNADITSDYDERTELAGIRMISLMIGGLISTFTHSIIIKIFKSHLDNGAVVYDFQKGYLLSGGIWGGIMLIPLAITFIGTRNIPTQSFKDSHIPFFKGLVVMFSNRAFITVTLLYFFCQIAVQFVQNNLVLYCKYVAKAEDLFPYILATLQVSVSIFIFFWGKVASIIGKKTVYYIGAVFLLAEFIGLFFLPSNNRYLLWGMAAFGGVGVSVAFLIPLSMLPDVVELDELKTGERREGLFYSLFLFFQKLGLSVGLAVSNFALGLAGYEAPQVVDGTDGLSQEIIDNNVENPNVIKALRYLVGVVPSIIVFFSFIAVFFYPISKSSHSHIKELLRKKREGSVVTVDG